METRRGYIGRIRFRVIARIGRIKGVRLGGEIEDKSDVERG